VKTGSELLDLTPPAPLSAILSARPVRVCVLVPSAQNVPWQRMVEHALATQTRVWGGALNLVIPPGLDLADDELFWRLVDLLDPDVLGIHMPSYADAEELAPDVYERVMADATRELANFGITDEGALAAHFARLRGEPVWRSEPPDLLKTRLVERTAPLTVGEDPDPRAVYFDGTSSPAYPLTDAAAINEISRRTEDIRTSLGDISQLLLTHSNGRLLPSARQALVEHGVNVVDVVVRHEYELDGYIWHHNGLSRDAHAPIAMSTTGLLQRARFEHFRRLIVVVGDEPRDFLLFHGLSRARPFVYWLPTAWLGVPPLSWTRSG
jgi:hypothetical protein